VRGAIEVIVPVDRLEAVFSDGSSQLAWVIGLGFFLTVVAAGVIGRRLVQRTESVAFFAQHNPAPVVRIDESGTLLDANPTAVRLLGERCTPGAKLEYTVLSCFEQDDITQCLKTQRPIIREMEIGDQNYQFTMISIPESHVVNVYGSNITKLTEVTERLRHLARHDDLTGLPNRKHFVERLMEALWRAERSDNPVLLMYIDLDGFKQINDTYGHIMGDVVLKEAARRFKNAIRRTDTVFRLGGDEFAVILEHAKANEKTIVARRICAAFEDPIDLPKGKPVTAGVSIGIAASPGCKSGQELINEADKAMYLAKQHTGNCFRFASDVREKQATS
jgi:diguanylate cyclase (GGDEF)-like protein